MQITEARSFRWSSLLPPPVLSSPDSGTFRWKPVRNCGRAPPDKHSENRHCGIGRSLSCQDQLAQRTSPANTAANPTAYISRIFHRCSEWAITRCVESTRNCRSQDCTQASPQIIRRSRSADQNFSSGSRRGYRLQSTFWISVQTLRRSTRRSEKGSAAHACFGPDSLDFRSDVNTQQRAPPSAPAVPCRLFYSSHRRVPD